MGHLHTAFSCPSSGTWEGLVPSGVEKMSLSLTEEPCYCPSLPGGLFFKINFWKHIANPRLWLQVGILPSRAIKLLIGLKDSDGDGWWGLALERAVCLCALREQSGGIPQACRSTRVRLYLNACPSEPCSVTSLCFPRAPFFLQNEMMTWDSGRHFLFTLRADY